MGVSHGRRKNRQVLTDHISFGVRHRHFYSADPCVPLVQSEDEEKDQDDS